MFVFFKHGEYVHRINHLAMETYGPCFIKIILQKNCSYCHFSRTVYETEAVL